MKTHKTAPSNSVGVARGSCERARIGVKARPGRSIGCEGMCEIQLEEGPPLHFLCIVGCRGDMWDMCGWSALFVMFVFTPYVHTRGGVNHQIHHHTHIRDVSGHHTNQFLAAVSSSQLRSQGVFLNNVEQRK